MLITAAISALLLTQPTPSAPPAAPAQKAPVRGRYTLIKIAGDLDSDHLVTAFGSELDQAKDASLVIVELDGNRARLDIVAKLGARIKTSQVPVSILIKDAVDKKAGVGELLLSGFARSCYVDPATAIEDASGADIRYLAPAETSWESVEREVTGALWTRLGDLQADQALSQVLLSARHDWWVVPGEPDRAWRLSEAAPAGGQAGPQPHQIIWASSSGTSSIRIDPDTAVGLRLCAAKVTNVNQILTDAGFSTRSTRTSRTVSSGLSDAQAATARILEDSKLAVRRVSNTLTVKSTQAHPAGAEDYRTAGKSALDQIDRASHELDRVEKLLADYPELERRPSTASKKSPGPCRAAVEALRKDLDKHKTTARDYQSR